MNNLQRCLLSLVLIVTYVLVIMLMLDVAILQKYKDAAIYGLGVLVLLLIMALFTE